MLTPEESALLQRHVSIDGDGNVVGNDNTVQVTKVDAETYVAEVKDERVTFTVQDLRQIHVEDSQVGVIGDNATVHGGINFIKKVVTSPWAVGLLALGVVLLSVIALANLPGAREQLPLWLHPRAFSKEREDEVLIVIAQFHTTEGVVDTAAHDEIKRAIEQEAGDLNLRVEVAPTSLRADNREGAQTLGNKYDASIVIWGADTGVRVSVNFYNRKQPKAIAADVQIQETARTQIAEPDGYAEFITDDLPKQLTFLALFALGQSYYTEEAYAESACAIENAVKVLEQQSNIINGAAEAYFRLGWLHQEPLASPEEMNLDRAYAAYSRALELKSNLAEAYNNRGLIQSQLNEYELALADYNRALECNPTLVEAYNNRGIAYRVLGDFNQALEDYALALSIDPSLTELYYNRGLTYSEMREYEAALRDFTHAIELDPNLADAYINRGNTYYEMGEYQKALSDYTRAIDLNPQLAEAYTNRGNTYEKMGKYQQAISNYNQALQVNPEDADAFYNRGNTYYEMDEYDQAVMDYSRALEINPVDAGVYYNRGIIYDEMGAYDQALADYTRALEIDPDNANAYYNRGNTHYEMSKYELALADYSETLEINPQDASAYHNRGLTYYKVGEYRLAVEDYVQAARLETDPAVYYNGARAYAQMGQVEESCAWFEKAAVLMSEIHYAASADPAFDPIRDAPCFQALMDASE